MIYTNQPINAHTPLQLLFVEADQGEREVVRVLLDKAKAHTYHVHTADRLDKAWVLLQELSIDVIILSLDLPDSEGLDTLMRMLRVAPHLPVIAVTADHDRWLGPRAIQAGATDFLDKSRTSQVVLERSISYAIARKWHEVAHLQAEQFAAMGTLAQGIAHQFNNINQAICGHTELLIRNESLPPEARRKLEIVLASARRASVLATQMIQLAETAPGDSRQASLNHIVEELLSILETQLVANEIHLERDLQPVPELELDVQGIRQALLNILINGIHALVAAPHKRLRVRTAVERNEAVVEIHDSGAGIAPADLTQLFCPFFGRKGELAGGSPLHVFRGPGLGLSISYGIVRLHGGDIQVRSHVGEGATFRISIPLEPIREDKT